MHAGYAHCYIALKWNKSTLENEADLSVYKSLFEIDYRLGSKPEHQLHGCCNLAVNLDIIMVEYIN